jgi:hypothetical protein
VNRYALFNYEAYHFLLQIVLCLRTTRIQDELFENYFCMSNEEVMAQFQRYRMVTKTVELKGSIVVERWWILIGFGHDRYYQEGHEADLIDIILLTIPV